MRFIIAMLLCLLLISGCQKDQPLRLGFVGGLSGRAADLGIAGRNGAQLAVEQRNATGGINGAQVELVIRDDQQNAATAQQVIGELLAQQIELIIGPMTSSMAMAMLPQIDASESILLSPTVTTSALSDKDDQFLRVIADTTDYASKSARYQYEKLGTRTVAVLYDLDNAAYTESWLNDFRATFLQLGGQLLLEHSFRSSADTIFSSLVSELLASNADTLLIISNAVDSALICQQLHKQAPKQPVALSEWAATERFIELAGLAAEGVVVSQFLNRNDQSPRYRDFVTAYRARFKQEPGFAGLAGYDAAMVALDALMLREKGETLKKTILDQQIFPGAQQQLSFDRFGDADRKSFISVIRDQQYLTVE